MAGADDPPALAKVYLVTGASSGIGRATAQALAGADASLVLVSRAPDALAVTRRECEAKGSSCLVVTADVRRPESVSSAFAEAVDRFGRIDAVIHCAAVLAYGSFEEVPEEVFAATIDTTLTGTATVARESLRQFRRQRHGRLVVLGSLLGSTALPYLSSYVAAKWGVHGLVRSLQIETRDDPGISVTLVSPGSVDTPIFRQAATYLGRHGKPLPPVQDPATVAQRVVAALDSPRREISSGPVNGLFVWAFRNVPALFDRVMPVVVRRLGLSYDTQLPPSPGNVFRPRTEREAVTGTETDPQIQIEETTMASDSQSVSSAQATPPGPMVSRRVEAPASAVWDVLADGWTYATWVVGASRVRDVEAGWPAAGSRIHHAFGPWPAVIQDYTKVEASTPERELVIKARGWPLGEARAVIRIAPDGDDRCTVSIAEDAVAGPGKILPHPLRQLVVVPRNKETLYRLALLAEGRNKERRLNAP